MSKEQFREFVKTKPELADYVKRNEMTWQKFYELYDMYGEDDRIWQDYRKTPQPNISSFLKKIDPDSMQKQIESAQKALDIFSELATKTTEKINTNIKPSIKRPLNKFFGD